MKSILFFDGVCNLCNGFINFLMPYFPSEKLKYASLQGKTAKEVLPAHLISELNSVVLLKDNKIYLRSSAIIELVALKEGAWKSIYIFYILPEFFRDFFYKIIAKYRYRIFGKKDFCRLPTQDELNFFLD